MKARSILLLSVLLADLSAAQAPPRRAHHSIFYDEAGTRVLLSGGSTPLDGGRSFEFFNDLWAFDGKGWTALPPSGDKMSGAAVAVGAGGKLYSFGGYAGRSVGFVRALENDHWRSLSPHPSLAVAEPGFVFDSKRGRFIAFGGSSGPARLLGDTWQFDGATWTTVAGSGPTPRAAHAMIYDVKRDRVVVFGGMGAGGLGQPPTPLGDTWEFDGTTWRRIEGMGPSARVSPGYAYDSKRGIMILFGGSAPSGFFGDTWSWDGRQWKKLADAGPEGRAMGYLAYDKARDRVVLFGGRKGYPDGDLNDTWEWDGIAWRRIGS